MPFDETLIKSGILISLAIKLYKDEVVSLSKAAKLAGDSIEAFTKELAKQNISVIQYSVMNLIMSLKLSTNIVVDTGPLIAFSHLDWFNHLSKLFSIIQISQQVFEESQFEQNKPGARTIAKAVNKKP